MAFTRLFTIETVDSIIVADQIVNLSSFALLLCILVWVIAGFRKHRKLSKPLSVTCLASIACFTLSAFVGTVGLTNVLFPISSVSCKIIYPMGLVTYNLAKILMYWLFTLRVELIFKDSALAFNNRLLSIYRVYAALIPSILWAIWIYISFADIKPHPIHKYSHCFPINFHHHVTIASHIAASLAWSDFLFSSIAVYVFVFKLFQLTHLQNDAVIDTLPGSSAKFIHGTDGATTVDDSELMVHSTASASATYHKYRQSLLFPSTISHKLIHIIRKSTVLSVIAIGSTWTYVLGTAYILRQCGFFLAFDCVINSLCLALLFKFGDPYYNTCCRPLERCCIDIICCCYCCRHTQQSYLARHEHEAVRSSSVCPAILLEAHYRDGNVNGDEIGLQYNGNNENDYSLDYSHPHSLNRYRSVSSYIQSKPNPQIIQKMNDATHDISAHMEQDASMKANTQSEEMVHREEDDTPQNVKPWFPKKVNRKSPSPKLHRKSPTQAKRKWKDRSSSLSTVNDDDSVTSAHSDQSATFMLLDDTSDEREDEPHLEHSCSYEYEVEDGGELYYDDDEALIEGDENEIEITDEESNHNH